MIFGFVLHFLVVQCSKHRGMDLELINYWKFGSKMPSIIVAMRFLSKLPSANPATVPREYVGARMDGWREEWMNVRIIGRTVSES